MFVTHPSILSQTSVFLGGLDVCDSTVDEFSDLILYVTTGSFESEDNSFKRC